MENTTSEEIQKLKDIIMIHEERIKQLESKFTNNGVDKSILEKKQSMAEFLLRKVPNGDNQKTLAVGYFLEHNENKESFTTKDLEEGYRHAKEKIPKNLSDTIYQNISRGYMMEIKDKKEGLRTLTLTSSGERFVENNFQKQK